MKIAADSRYALFASGHGSNARALLEKGFELQRPASLVIVTNADSSLVSFCHDQKNRQGSGVEVVLIQSKIKGLDAAFESEVLSCLQKHRIDWVFLAGFLKILSANFLSLFKKEAKGQILNIHPSLLPLYPGLGGYKKSYQNEDKFFGHTIHFVDEKVDGGAIVRQKKIEADLNLSLADYSEVGKKEENASYAKVLEELLLGTFSVDQSIEV